MPLPCRRATANLHAHHRLTTSKPRQPLGLCCSFCVTRCSHRREPLPQALFFQRQLARRPFPRSYQCEHKRSHCTQRCSTLFGSLALFVCVIPGETSYTMASGEHSIADRRQHRSTSAPPYLALSSSQFVVPHKWHSDQRWLWRAPHRFSTNQQWSPIAPHRFPSLFSVIIARLSSLPAL